MVAGRVKYWVIGLFRSHPRWMYERRNNVTSVKSLFNEDQRINTVLSNVSSPRSHGSHPPSYEAGCDHSQSLCLKLLTWSLMKVPTHLQDEEGCNSQLTKAQGKDSVI